MEDPPKPGDGIEEYIMMPKIDIDHISLLGLFHKYFPSSGSVDVDDLPPWDFSRPIQQSLKRKNDAESALKAKRLKMTEESSFPPRPVRGIRLSELNAAKNDHIPQGNLSDDSSESESKSESESEGEGEGEGESETAT